MRNVEGIILVGGMGTRLRPLTDTCPKPMLPVAGVPLVERQMRRLRDVGIERVVLATSYKAEVFRDAYGSGDSLDLDLRYSYEHEPLGTGGAIREATEFLSENCEHVVILNGDILSDHDLEAQVGHHVLRGSDVTLHTRHVDPADAARFGTVLTESSRVQAFLEKHPEPVSTRINAGCYVFRADVARGIPTGVQVSVERDTFPGLIADGAKVSAYDSQGYWIDVGTLETYEQANRDLQAA